MWLTYQFGEFRFLYDHNRSWLPINIFSDRWETDQTKKNSLFIGNQAFSKW